MKPHLNLLRVNEKAQVRSQWYDWKFHWVNELLVTAEAGFNRLAAVRYLCSPRRGRCPDWHVPQDATFLERVNKESHDLLVTLRHEYEEVTAELKKDEEEVAEIENCDQEYLSELKTSLAVQRYKFLALHIRMAPDSIFFIQHRVGCVPNGCF